MTAADPEAAARGAFGGLIAGFWDTRRAGAATRLEAVRSRSRPDRGMLRAFIEVSNRDSVVVMSLKSMNLLRCRSNARDSGT